MKRGYERIWSAEVGSMTKNQEQEEKLDLNFSKENLNEGGYLFEFFLECTC